MFKTKDKYVYRTVDSCDHSPPAPRPPLYRLTLEVPVSVPLSPPLPANIPPSQYLCATSTQPLKFKGTSAGDSLSVEAKVRRRSFCCLC